jgi:hypothetical protein
MDSREGTRLHPIVQSMQGRNARSRALDFLGKSELWLRSLAGDQLGFEEFRPRRLH